MKKLFDFSHFRTDLFGGITAGIVALPLALAFGEQSGLGAAAGLYGAALIAFFAAMFGGTATQISGPTAPMTALSMVIVAGLVQVADGNVGQALPWILLIFLLAGVIQIFLGVFKLGSLIKYIPYTVVSGFMTGIGVIILITQIPAFVGYQPASDAELIEQFKPQAREIIVHRILDEKQKGGELSTEVLEFTLHSSETITDEQITEEAKKLASGSTKGVIGSIKNTPRALQHLNFTEFLLALSTILIIYGFKKITKAIPSTLVALLVITGAAVGFNLDYLMIKEIPAGLPTLHYDIFTSIDMEALSPFLFSAVLLALLGAIDSLLTSVVADNITKTQHDPNKELIGQGIGNGIAAFFGGLPGAGATIRTVVNIQAGGKTKLSGMMAGVFLFLILLLLGPIASQIPAAVLAGILITVGIGVMDYKGLRALPYMDHSEKVILILVLVLTVFWQLVYAVAIGLVLASLVFLKKMSEHVAESAIASNSPNADTNEFLWKDESELDKEMRKQVMFKHLEGPMFFGVVNKFRSVISELKDIKILVIRMEKVPFIDHSGLYSLEEAIQSLNAKGIKVAISKPNKQTLDSLKGMKIVPNLVNESNVFDEFSECAKWIKSELMIK